METLVAATAFVCAAIPAALFLLNLRHYKALPPGQAGDSAPGVSVLIPARNEEGSIRAAIATVLSNSDVDLELIILDDGSTDRTTSVAEAVAAGDPRVRIMQGPPLPPGWCGKQHACWVLAAHASKDLLCFMDADVRLAPMALSRICASFLRTGVGLASGFPRQVTGTFLERLLLPLIHFILLGFLPVKRMRSSRHPAFAAGCGQLMIAGRTAYFEAGGHAAIRSSLHDGITLPRAFRRAGIRTDLFDATDLATCRMYHSASEVWNGIAKNATEGLASPQRIGWITAILIAGQVLPFAMLVAGILTPLPAAAALLALCPRLIAAGRFRQSFFSALLHPMGVLILLAIQWYACIRALAGRSATWKGRPYPAGGARTGIERV